MAISLVYARPDVQVVRAVTVPRGTTIRSAIERSRILEEFPEIDLAVNRVGVYGELRDLGATLQPGDRVEIYRPLTIDPKEARRRKVASER